MKQPQAIQAVLGMTLDGLKGNSDCTSMQPSPPSSALSPRLTSQVAAVRKRYGGIEQFLRTFHVNNQERYTEDADRCYFGTCPTMGLVNTAYGKKTAGEWLVYQLTDLSEFCGCREKITAMQIEQLAAIIASDFYFLKLTEMMLFFRKFKKGDYGRFYGNIDPLIITSALRMFLRERNERIARRDEEEQQRRDAEARENAITWEEYVSKYKGE